MNAFFSLFCLYYILLLSILLLVVVIYLSSHINEISLLNQIDIFSHKSHLTIFSHSFMSSLVCSHPINLHFMSNMIRCIAYQDRFLTTNVVIVLARNISFGPFIYTNSAANKMFQNTIRSFSLHLQRSAQHLIYLHQTKQFMISSHSPHNQQHLHQLEISRTTLCAMVTGVYF
ncbi:hypothetical protein DFA_02061 [Cavenderia fasciculata]|uniref:Transmembrane protein n=1 Tax=Cavenderia fasciculata TaxID=261658 RepID=F4PYK8_CACFS|nr:uncharacterized protein DFA_02061 [Cavenderia fasciculata]EGG19274.1 hypothetical protein DFA_02061 [Cavenderia fasciculata]|eukprot:XP_004357545.1 hypothetical protein DFA_02061 [Cavenderia fasciculata]